MASDNFTPFFAASAGAGAALLGLLFVAISVAPERTVGPTASPLRQATSATVFSALANAFFLSLAALLPRSNIGYVALALSLVSIINTLSLAVRLSRQGLTWKNVLNRFTLVAASLVIFSFELFDSIKLLTNESDASAVFAIATLTIAIYGIGLVRAWELLGARRQNNVLTLLSPLREEEDETPP